MMASLGRTVGLSLNFIHMTALVRHPAKPGNNFDGNVNDLLTYDDPSPKSILLPTGELQSGTTLRTDYDVAGVALGLLVEGEATNLLLQSDNIGTSSWQKRQGTAPASSQFRENTETNVHGFRQSVPVADGPLAWSMDVKGIGRDHVTLFGETGAAFNNRFEAVVDLDAGVVVSIQDFGTWNGTTIDVGPVDVDRYRRIKITTETGARGGDGTVWYYIAGHDGSNFVYTGDTNNGYDFRRGQFEVGAAVTSYIPTTTAAVTRNEDVILLPFSRFPWNGGNGILEVDGIETAPTVMGDALRIVPRSGQTHVKSYRWVPAA